MNDIFITNVTKFVLEKYILYKKIVNKNDKNYIKLILIDIIFKDSLINKYLLTESIKRRITQIYEKGVTEPFFGKVLQHHRLPFINNNSCFCDSLFVCLALGTNFYNIIKKTNYKYQHPIFLFDAIKYKNITNKLIENNTIIETRKTVEELLYFIYNSYIKENYDKLSNVYKNINSLRTTLRFVEGQQDDTLTLILNLLNDFKYTRYFKLYYSSKDKIVLQNLKLYNHRDQKITKLNEYTRNYKKQYTSNPIIIIKDEEKKSLEDYIKIFLNSKIWQEVDKNRLKHDKNYDNYDYSLEFPNETKRNLFNYEKEEFFNYKVILEYPDLLMINVKSKDTKSALFEIKDLKIGLEVKISEEKYIITSIICKTLFQSGGHYTSYILGNDKYTYYYYNDTSRGDKHQYAIAELINKHNDIIIHNETMRRNAILIFLNKINF